MFVLMILFVFVVNTSCLIYRDDIIVSSKEIEEIDDENNDINPYSPLVLCHFL